MRTCYLSQSFCWPWYILAPNLCLADVSCPLGVISCVAPSEKPFLTSPGSTLRFLSERKEELNIIYLVLSELNIIGNYLFHSFVFFACLFIICLPPREDKLHGNRKRILLTLSPAPKTAFGKSKCSINIC